MKTLPLRKSQKPNQTRAITRTIAVLAALVLGVTLAPAGPATALTGGTEASQKTPVVKVVTAYGTCTGVVIDSWWIATGASCFTQNPAEYFSLAEGKPELPAKALFGADASWRDNPGTGIEDLRPYRGANYGDERDLVLAKLASPTNVTPVKIATKAPVVGESLEFTGWGRTKTEWAPRTAKTGTFNTTEVRPKEIVVTGTNNAALCLGDTGAPGLRNGELVALNSRSWQKNCVGVNQQENDGAWATRVDDLGDWVATVTSRKIDARNQDLITLKNGDNNQCMRFKNIPRDPADTAWTASCENTPTTMLRFELLDRGNPVFSLRTWASRQCVSSSNSRLPNTKNIVESECDEKNDAQKWEFVPGVNGSKHIRNIATGKYLDLDEKNNLIQETVNLDRKAQQWFLGNQGKTLTADDLKARNNQNDLVSIQTTNPGWSRPASVRHASGLGSIPTTNQNSSPLQRQDSSWRVVPGLKDASCVSFQSLNVPWIYLGVNMQRLRVETLNNYDAAAVTWCARSSTQVSDGIVLGSYANPGLSLRHRNGELWVGWKEGGWFAGGDGPNNDLFDQDSTWRIGTPWSTEPEPAQPQDSSAITFEAKRLGLGNPYGDIKCGLKNGGCLQYYPEGIVYWSKDTGAQVTKNGILDTWAGTGYEGGPLGYPISLEKSYRPGEWFQSYQNGTIYWVNGVTRIQYN